METVTHTDRGRAQTDVPANLPPEYETLNDILATLLLDRRQPIKRVAVDTGLPEKFLRVWRDGAMQSYRKTTTSLRQK